MKRILTACLSLGAALALAATAEAQDTSQAGAAPMPDSAPTTQAQGDTLGGDSTKWGYPGDTAAPQNPPGYRGMERPVGDSAADSVSAGGAAEYNGTASDSARTDSSTNDTSAADTSSTGKSTTSAAPDTTLPGDENPRQPETPERRIHSDSAGADSASS